MRRSPSLVCVIAVATAMATGACGGCQPTDQRLEKALQQAGAQKEHVFPLSGRVTVDGAPAECDPRRPVIVVLIDRDTTAEAARGRRFVECETEGRFSFRTYARNDGVKPGRYVVAIAKLERTGVDGYAGSDQFHNRYNDPDKNAQDATFEIEHNSPGKTDYEFHLTIAGAEPVETPGPHAITHIP